MDRLPAVCRPAVRSRWVSPGPASYRITATAGDSDEPWFDRVGGLASEEDRLFVFDPGRARVTVLSSELAGETFVGGEGDGPGEFAVRPHPPTPYWDWMDGGRDTLFVFDGIRLHSFVDLQFVSRYEFESVWESPNLYTNRVEVRKGDAYFDNGDYSSLANPETGGDGLVFRVSRRSLAVAGRGRAARVFELPLSPVPRNDAGVPYIGPRQAVPIWDLRDGCLVVTDGAEGELYLTAVDAGETYRMDVALASTRTPRPVADDPGSARAQAFERLPPDAREAPEPTALARIRGLLVDPDGWVWLDLGPAGDGMGAGGETGTGQRGGPQGPEGREVLVVRPREGPGEGPVTRRLTLPVFPSAFGAPGVFYGVTRDAVDRQLLHRVRARNGSSK